MDDESIFAAALRIQADTERAAFLDKACAGNAALRAEIESLLKAHSAAGSFLSHPPAALARGREAQPGQDNSQESEASEVSLWFLEPCDEPGRIGKLGAYQVIEVIGQGGMGIVLRARDPKLNRTVALKVLSPQLAANPTARKRFIREARAAAAITHPHVIAIHAVEETENTPYLVMECVDGMSLEEKIAQCGPLELKEALRIGAQIAAGLAAAHAHGLVHRDIKPSNILLENSVERVKITDFGLARAVDDVSITRPGEVAGTPEFMSPEQAQGKPVDPRSDLFSLGAVLYAMCTGRSPFRAESTMAVLRRVCDDVPRPIREVNPEVPEELMVIIDRLLAKEPGGRFTTAEEVSDLLLSYLAHLQDAAGGPSAGILIPSVGQIPNLPWGSKPSEVSGKHAQGEYAQGARATRRWPRRGLLLAALVPFGLCVAVAATEATGVTHLAATILRITTGAGTLVVEVDDPQVSITIDGEDLRITGAGPQEVRLKPGAYQVQATKGGQIVKEELVTIERGGRQIVRVALKPFVTSLANGGPVAAPPLVPLSSNQWVDLLPRVDSSCLHLGQWERHGEAFVWRQGALSIRGVIVFPVALYASYDLQLDFRVLSGVLAATVAMPVGGTQCQATFDSWRTGADGIEQIDGHEVVQLAGGSPGIDKQNPTVRKGSLLEEGEHSLLIQVRVKEETASIDVLRNGKPYLSWKGKLQSLSLPGPADYGGLEARRPAMSLWRADTSLNRVRVRLVSA